MYGEVVACSPLAHAGPGTERLREQDARKRYVKVLVCFLGACLALLDAGAAKAQAPPCPLPNADCPVLCAATPANEANMGVGNPQQTNALLADVDIVVDYDDGNGVSGNGKICDGTAVIVGEECATCSQCYVATYITYNNHAGNPAYEWNVATTDFPGGSPWSGLLNYGRSGYLKVNCADSGFNRLNITSDGGATILYTEGVTLQCGC